MAKNLKLNIKMFGAEGSFLPTAWEGMVNQYDQELPNVNKTFVNHQDVLEIFRNAEKSYTEGKKERFETAIPAFYGVLVLCHLFILRRTVLLILHSKEIWTMEKRRVSDVHIQ